MEIMEQQRVTSDKLADAMVAAVDAGATDEVVMNEVVKLALTIIQNAQGGRREAVAIVLRNIAQHIEENPDAAVTIN